MNKLYFYSIQKGGGQSFHIFALKWTSVSVNHMKVKSLSELNLICPSPSDLYTIYSNCINQPRGIFFTLNREALFANPHKRANYNRINPLTKGVLHIFMCARRTFCGATPNKLDRVDDRPSTESVNNFTRTSIFLYVHPHINMCSRHFQRCRSSKMTSPVGPTKISWGAPTYSQVTHIHKWPPGVKPSCSFL